MIGQKCHGSGRGMSTLRGNVRHAQDEINSHRHFCVRRLVRALDRRLVDLLHVRGVVRGGRLRASR